MSRLKIILFLILTPILAFVLVYYFGRDLLLGSEPTAQESTVGVELSKKIHSKASYFDLPSLDNKRIKLSDLEGSPAIIFFWATWSSESSDMVKIFDDYLAQEGASGNNLVKVVGIESQEDSSVGSSFIRRGGYTVPIAVDFSGSVTEEYTVNSIPTVFFIDSEGIIKDISVGPISIAQIVDKAEAILK